MKRNESCEVSLDDLIANPCEISPVTYQYYKNLKNRRVIINDEIDQAVLEMAILPLLEMDSDGTGAPIEIVLSTVGGSVFDGMALCDTIDNLRTETTIVVPTYAYSMGGLILMAGYSNKNVKKRCFKHSTGLIHGGSSYLNGNSFAVKDQFNFYQKFEDSIKTYILSHSKITEEEYKQMERCEWYMTSADMLEKGLVDEVV